MMDQEAAARVRQKLMELRTAVRDAEARGLTVQFRDLAAYVTLEATGPVDDYVTIQRTTRL